MTDITATIALLRTRRGQVAHDVAHLLERQHKTLLEIRTIITQVRELDTVPSAACNTIGTLLDIIDEEETTHGITG